ncbi:MAG: ROK family protein [Oceanicaulis sp.]|uniref:ROK family protein n=1 Tax=Glycocaulis sp. TaxID=1969725 RepID=UPI0025B8FEB7|nr:ROK family protein [Glycocaulis sp.]MCC5981379.1 ROK family protein [Oceanicaulis sp.]MCH8522439.1 ROK family protein [Glycocaulis sp.]
MIRIGVDMGGTKIEAAALDPSGAIRARRRIASIRDYSILIESIRTLIRETAAEAGAERFTVGIGHPGSINPRTGLVRNANSSHLNGKPLDRDLSDALGQAVRCANDANCFALSEARDGAGAGARCVFGVIIGTGVGGGIVMNGQLYEGNGLIAGEWGHTGLPRPDAEEVPGPQCGCGRLGCVESWCSGPALAADHARVAGEALAADAIAAKAADGDAAARATMARHAGRLARSLSTIVNVLDPDIVVLGGGLSNVPGIDREVEARLEPHVFSDEMRTRVVVNKHGDSSGVRGAAWLWPLEAR